jgi:hypothetical protein
MTGQDAEMLIIIPLSVLASSGTTWGAAIKIDCDEHCTDSVRSLDGSHSSWLVVRSEASDRSSDRGNLVISVAWPRIHLDHGCHCSGSSRRVREGLIRYKAR